MKLNAAARIKMVKATSISADANEFVKLTDALSEILEVSPVRKPGTYTYCTDIAGREFDVVVKDKGRAINVAVEKDGQAKYQADVNTVEVGIRAVEEGVKVYIRHEVKDAKAAKLFLKRFSRRPILLTTD